MDHANPTTRALPYAEPALVARRHGHVLHVMQEDQSARPHHRQVGHHVATETLLIAVDEQAVNHRPVEVTPNLVYGLACITGTVNHQEVRLLERAPEGIGERNATNLQSDRNVGAEGFDPMVE